MADALNFTDADPATIAWQLRQILRRYAVRMHYADSAAKRQETGKYCTVYAVFKDGVQVGPSTSHREAQDLREAMTISDIAQMFGTAA